MPEVGAWIMGDPECGVRGTSKPVFLRKWENMRISWSPEGPHWLGPR